MYMWMGAAVQ